jgi:TolA-binding protein
MRSPLRNFLPMHKTPYLTWALCAALTFGPALHAANIQVPLPQILNEMDSLLKGRHLAQASPLLDGVLDRVDKGETLPQGVNLDNLLLLSANTHFQLKEFSVAETVAQKLLKRVSTGQIAADARLVLGLALALQNKFAEAVPVFGALEESSVYHDKALMYRSMAAQQAGQPTVAIDALNRLLATAPHDADWADSALTLISLQLQQPNLEAATKGLALLRSNLKIVENIAGLNTLSLQLGDALLAAQDPAGALAAYRTVFPREELLRRQDLLTKRMEAWVVRQKALNLTSVTDADALRRVEARIKATKAALDEITKKADYDSALYYRLGHTFLLRGGDWEAALALERLLKDYPDSEEKERSSLELVRAYAESGRLDRMKDALERFTKSIPSSQLLPQALYVAAQAAADKGRGDMQLKFLDMGVTLFPNAELTEYMILMQANAYFASGKFTEAQAAATRYVSAYPKGKFAEDATYLKAMASLVLGRIEDSIKQINEYLAQYPEGRFVSDGRYRIGAAEFALQHYESAEQKLTSWLKDYPPEDPRRGEVLSALGDVYAGEDRIDDAIASYRNALLVPLSDDLMGYVLDELTRHYQGKRDYNTAATMWSDFARDHPDHLFVINAAYWIGKLRAKEGNLNAAIDQMSSIAQRYMADSDRDTVERLLTQIATLLARPPKAGADGVKPPAPTTAEIAQRIESLLMTPETRNNPTVKARVWFTESEVASFRKNTPLRDELLTRIGDRIPPEALPPGLLGCVGDLLLEQGKLEPAKAFYNAIILRFPKSIYADFGYVGLGELAYRKGDYDTALTQFSNAIDRAGARFKLLDATLGRAKTLFAKGKLDEAKELFEQIASNRQWRGPATAQSVYSLGEILVKRGGSENLAQAQATFQRVYLSYKKYTPWVARAYISSGETFEKLGQLREALNTYREMVRDKRFADYPELAQAKSRISVLEPQVPATPAGGSS